MCGGKPETGRCDMRHIEETGDDDMDMLTIAGVIREWRKRDRERRELQRMSDHELADIGLVRNDIEAVVRGNYERSR